ncbi:MAG TPA: phosphatidylglycerophosphatase A [Myxococcales bacterium]|nr:phosphatidylglycerophosphatase A [Myxococcales bacterium]HIL81592.1 phosphatidylglycerophosphatase A [Myxococcales bacterium]
MNSDSQEDVSHGAQASPVAGPAVWIATVGGVGFGPWAPGTYGALVAVVVFGLGAHRLGGPLYGLVLVGLSGLGVWASSAAEAYFGRHDDGRIVVDEFVGQLIALFPLVLLQGISLGGLEIPGLESTRFERIDFWWLLVVTGFVAFRWFDIRKPGPVKWAEDRFERGAGVMADDIVAGFLAAIVVILPAYVLVAIKLQTAQAVIEQTGSVVDELIRSTLPTLLPVAEQAVQVLSLLQMGDLGPEALGGFIA